MTEFSSGALHIEKRGLKSQSRLNKLTISLLALVCVFTLTGNIVSVISANSSADSARDTQKIVAQGEANRDSLESLLQRIEALQEADAAAGKDRAADSAQRAKELKAEINALRHALGLPPSKVKQSSGTSNSSADRPGSPAKKSSKTSTAPRKTTTSSKPAPSKPAPAKPQPAPAPTPDRGVIGSVLDGLGLGGLL